MSLLTTPRLFCPRLRMRVAFSLFAYRSIHTEGGSAQGDERLFDISPPGPALLPQIISTLNPDLLLPTDYLDLSRLDSKAIRFPTSQRGSWLSIAYNANPSQGAKPPISFPDKSAGYLYYDRPQDAAPLEGGVRLRVVVPSKAAAASPRSPSSTFHHGHDLLTPIGLPWQISLPQIACSARYAVLLAELLAEYLATENQLAQCRAIFAEGRRWRVEPESTVFRLGQPFPVNLAEGIDVTVIGRDALHRLWMPDVFRVSSKEEGEPYNRAQSYAPWAGTALASFEPSSTPADSDPRRRIVHLRFTHISPFTPIKTNMKNGAHFKGILKPRAGTFLTRTRRGGRAPVRWGCDIDVDSADGKGKVGEALRMLWDNSRIS
ncbi:hypothetical protein MVEN_01644600 [Mycena venus]|uniref:Uncharacterized protein n=1 Tax=Mycena venus TaxID=2733690 RepID=A0A8H7CRI0_9AGAR|nr:hypothetical protein MVEN_01644600 [Mycena venus]